MLTFYPQSVYDKPGLLLRKGGFHGVLTVFGPGSLTFQD
jgi:hypothetical protein